MFLSNIFLMFLSNIFLVTSSKEKLSITLFCCKDIVATLCPTPRPPSPPLGERLKEKKHFIMLQRCHCNTMPHPHATTPKPLGERLKEKKHSEELRGHLGRWMVSGRKTVFCWVPVP
jgi:hypothetical protein